MNPRAYLVPAALAVWATAIAGLLWAWWAALAVGLTAAVLGGLALRPWRPAAVAVAVAAPLAACWIGAQVHEAARHPLRAAAERGTSTTVHFELDDRPHGLRASGFGSRAGWTWCWSARRSTVAAGSPCSPRRLGGGTCCPANGSPPEAPWPRHEVVT